MSPIITPQTKKSPEIPSSVFVAENATIIGDVIIGKNSSIWFQSVIRGDVNKITIGSNVNIQDGVIVHCTYQKNETTIGNNVSVGHRAIVHGCQIKNNVLIGMGAIVMDKCIIGEGSIIAAGAVVLENTIVPPNTLYAGVPAKEIKKLKINSGEEIKQVADNYLLYKTWYE